MSIFVFFSCILVLVLILISVMLVSSFQKQSALHNQILSLNKSSALSYLCYLPFNNPSPIFCVNKEGKILFVSLSGNSLMSDWDLKKGDILPAALLSLTKAVFEQNQKQIQIINLKTVVYQIEIIPDKALKTAGIYINDITKQKQTEQKLVKTTLYDLSTNLPNRALFMDYIKLEVTYQRKGHKVFIMVIKLIDYIELFMHQGERFCEKVIHFTQLQLKRFLSDQGVLAKLAEKEFGLMEPIYSEPSQAADLCKKIISYFDKPLKIVGKEVVSRVAIGLAYFPEDGSTPEALLRHAKKAQQEALSEVSRFSGYHLDKQADSQKGLLVDLYKALESQEFSLVYQPQISVKDRALIGAEALIRWEHPELGFISPLSFIPLAESSGLIVPLGKWIVQKVCEDLAHWRAQDIKKWEKCKIAINLSAVQFKDLNLIVDVEQTLKQYALPAKAIEFELTESILSDSIEDVIAIMNQLKDKGFSLSMDDFGTGYSSLSYLKKLPIDKLKIDKAFIDDIEYHSPSLEMVKGITKLGHNLGLKILAEGVENVNQFELLKDLNCNIIQGYFFSKPLVAKDFEQFLPKV